MKVPFLELKPQFTEIKRAFDVGFRKLIFKSDYILGDAVTIFENKFAAFVGARFALGVNSGTDALFLSLQSCGVGPGDEVILPVFTYIASAFAVVYTGAKPVFVDSDPQTYTMDVGKLERAVSRRTKAIMPVHLYGLAADMRPIQKIAGKYGLKVIEDAAQAHGSEYRGRRVGALGDAGAFSFYPTKNLGALGDAGAIVTNNAALFRRLKRLRDYGRISRYVHGCIGYNSRLDTLQALVLNKKLNRIERWNRMRVRAAEKYLELLKNIKGIKLPVSPKDRKHIFHVFTIRVKNRSQVAQGLKKRGVQTQIYYPKPLHLQPVFKNLKYKRGDFPEAEKACREVLALPIYPHIKERQIRYVAASLKKVFKDGEA